MELEKFECSQCGSGEYEALPENKIKCSYCGTVYKIKDKEAEKPKVVIMKGANVVFGEKSNVTIIGGVNIEEGANVSFLGRLEIVEKGDEEKIKNSIYKKK